MSSFSLDAELESADVVYDEINKGVIFKGTNLWILIFAIIVASVGLNMNSTAVIIGAMLISPLMGPINGVGYSIATFDFELFRKSIKNFLFAIIASLIASTTYFALSPVSTAHSELLARTSPTIYDVLIALFGGLAGIVAISSKQKGNVLPGVAIATALMPPLCTASYGLATGQFNFFFGAFYLFTINSIFMAIASVWISQLLKFPIRTIVDPSRRRKINNSISIVITIVLLPSIYFGYKLVQKENFIRIANSYVSNVSIFEGNFLLKHDIDVNDNVITLVYGGTALTENQKQNIIDKSKDFDIMNATILIEQGLSLGNLEEKNIELYKLREEIANLNISLSKKNLEIEGMLKKQEVGLTILNEIKPIFPQIVGCRYTESLHYRDSSSPPEAISTVFFTLNAKLNEADRTRIVNWVKQRVNKDDVVVYFE